MAALGVLAEPPAPSAAHRAAAAVESRYWQGVGVSEMFPGAAALTVKRGAVTAVAAAPGFGGSIAAGTSEGEVIVWRLPSGASGPEDEVGPMPKYKHAFLATSYDAI